MKTGVVRRGLTVKNYRERENNTITDYGGNQIQIQIENTNTAQMFVIK